MLCTRSPAQLFLHALQVWKRAQRLARFVEELFFCADDTPPLLLCSAAAMSGVIVELFWRDQPEVRLVTRHRSTERLATNFSSLVSSKCSFYRRAVSSVIIRLCEDQIDMLQ